MKFSSYFNLWQLINEQYHKKNNIDDKYKYWFNYSNTYSHIGTCSICSHSFSKDNLFYVPVSEIYEIVINHGLTHFPLLKLFI